MIPSLYSFLGLSPIKWAAILSVVFFIWIFYRYLTGQRTGIVTMLSFYGQYIYVFFTIATTLVVCWLTFSALHENVYATGKNVFKTGKYSATVLSYRFNEATGRDVYSYYVEVEYRDKKSELVKDQLDVSMSKAPTIGDTITIDYSFTWEQWYLLFFRGIGVVISVLCMGGIAFIVLLGLGSMLFKGSLVPVEALIQKVSGITVKSTMVIAAFVFFGGNMDEHPSLFIIYIFYLILTVVFAFFFKAYQMATTTTVTSPYDRKKKKRKKKRR